MLTSADLLHPSTHANEWAGTESHLANHAHSRSQQFLDAYHGRPLPIIEHANIERATAQGGYGRHQLYELIQNGADALWATPRGRIHVLRFEYHGSNR